MSTTNLYAMHEAKAAAEMATKLPAYEKKYAKYFEELDSSPLSKFRRITKADRYKLGKQIEQSLQWQAALMANPYMESDGSTANLGTLPKVVAGALTIAYGQSPINYMASVQPIDEVQQLVFYKNFVAQNTRGNVTAGQNIFSTLAAPDVYPNGYSSATVRNYNFYSDSAGTQEASNVAFAGSQDFGKPINPQLCSLTFAVTFGAGAVTFTPTVNPATGAFADMQIAGASTLVGVQGTVNFTNGTASWQFTTAPSTASNDVVATVTYETLPEAGTDVQKANLQMVSTLVTAREFALKSTYGLFEEFQAQKRFGISLAEDSARDLAAAINEEIMNIAVALLVANVPSGNAFTWDRQPQNGESLFEHMPTLPLAMADTSASIIKSAGRGDINCWVVGRSAAAILSTFENSFKLLYNDMSFGAHLYGTFNGVPVVRVPYNPVLGDYDMIGICKGQSNFEAPIVYAPFMPLVITPPMPQGFNFLQTQRGAAQMAAIDLLVPNFLASLTINPSGFSY